MPRPVLYLDIETLPCLDPQSRIDAAARVTPPANYSKPETIAAWERDQKPALVEEKWRKTSFDGAHGHLLSVAWAVDDGPVTLAYGGRDYLTDNPAGSTAQEMADIEERYLYHVFQSIYESMEREGLGTAVAPIVCAHYADFDIRFIFQRAVICGVKLPRWWPINVAPWKGDVFDTMTTWAGIKGTISQDRLATALGLPGKGDFDGSMVYDAWVNRQHDRIGTYNCDDVRTLRSIHKHLIATGAC